MSIMTQPDGESQIEQDDRLYPDHEMHEFLLTTDGELQPVMQKLPQIRNFIDELADTAATFRLKQIEDIYQPNFDNVHLEFLKSWPVHEVYAPVNERVYVNPNYVHAHTYTDMIVECECGTKLSRNYEDANNALRAEHNHTDSCLPHYRLEARADMTKQRYETMWYLGSLGWKGSDMAARFGSKPSSMGVLADRFNTDLRTVYEQYRRVAGNTYTYLVQDRGESASEIAEIYGHAQSTMTRWAKQYSDYETKRGRNQFSA